jgi:hypothetical protein
MRENSSAGNPDCHRTERLRVAEKEKVISDLQRQIGILKQKAEQGSMQLQGEVLELDLENQLKAAFVHDLVQEVSKGTCGGDVQHQVQTNTGHPCGMILWETKRTKNWSVAWTDKTQRRYEGCQSRTGSSRDTGPA